MYYKNIREEELKNKVGEDWFKNFDTTEIIGNIDFSVFPSQGDLFGRIPLLWAEAKTGNYDTTTMFVQLILTIGKARTFDKTLPPAFLGAFDFQKIAFVPYISIQDIFYLNDFNWNVTPSNHETKEFQLIKERIEKTLKQNAHIYDYEKDAKELKFFIDRNIANSTHTAKIKIDKNNFIPIYLRWLDIVKPSIEVNWDDLKKVGILDSDFYLADLFVDDKNTQNIEDDQSVRDSLFVIYQNQGYKIAKENLNQMFDATISIRNKEVYQQFWKRYKRPPLKEYQEYIIERRDLLVPQDIRERKGAFFTPRQWVELSQKYLTDYLGENWQDEYYIWDCAAGTGNLLAGLTNKYNIYASTLDQADVNVMHERIEHGANLLKNHVFQFDFLNDEFIPQKEGGKMPDSLYEIISNEEKRKKLVIYINPPYAEAGTTRQRTGTGINKENVSKGNKTHTKYKPIIKQAANEIFALFLIRIYKEIPLCKIAEFSTLKILQSKNFSYFRKEYRAKLEKIFIVPANTFDNVKGKFPIGFKIWNCEKKEIFKEIVSTAYVYEKSQNNTFVVKKGDKIIIQIENEKIILPETYINDWIVKTRNNKKNSLGTFVTDVGDFQNQNQLYICNPNEKISGHKIVIPIIKEIIISICTYFAVRHCKEATWKNDRRQYEIPTDGWQTDTEFQSDCLAYTLFHGQNRISSKEGINHWIPFTEQEVDAPERFASNFMTDFIKGKIKPTEEEEHQKIFNQDNLNLIPSAPLVFSSEAQAVFDAGRELWRYYMKQENSNPNASLYDIREHFQGRNDKGKMNNNSNDETYTRLIGKLREALKVLAEKITTKVFEYGFLRK